MNATWHYFLATNCTPYPGGQKTDRHERVEVRLVTIDQLFENARRGLMTDSGGVFLAYEKLMQLRDS
jgi:hypothetical protein